MVVFKQGGCQSDKYHPWLSSSLTVSDLSASHFVVSIKPIEQFRKTEDRVCGEPLVSVFVL